MLPVLQIGPLSLPTYPLALLLAGWIALEVGARAARRLGLDGDHIYNAGVYALAAGAIGGRLGHVVAYWTSYRTQLLEIFGFNSRAFLLGPAVIAALVVASCYLYRQRLPLARVLDAAAPGALAGAAVASLGALLAGRAYGAPADLPWTVNLWGVARHPSQVYEALAALAVALLVLRMIRQGGRPGAAALVALAGYGLSRWLLEPFRAAEVSPVMLGGLRAVQVWGLGGALMAMWGLRATGRRTGEAGAVAE